mmetsp:Transcript_9998/g.20211  ORF Transcript_9998/g.20211 Transcript_9998/m.20211 type:complete len:99 (-) Transcript_9998:9-305(-)
MRRTWADNPTSARIVEDISRYPLIIDKIIEYKGGLVPDFSAQHNGCSKRKRKVTDPCRLYTEHAVRRGCRLGSHAARTAAPQGTRNVLLSARVCFESN